MKKGLLVALLLLAAGSGYGYHYYMELRQQAGLDSPWPRVVGIPPQARQTNLPPYQGVFPRFQTLPEEYFHFPIDLGDKGPIEPLNAGSLQYPFLCQSEESGLGQPLVDNTQGWGVPVFAETPNGKRSDLIVGYSKNCSLRSQLHYLYYLNDDRKYPQQVDADILKVPTNTELLIRAETGTINRSMYTLLMPTTDQDRPADPDTTLWNHKLIYYFKGGISIGFQQGKLRLDRIIKEMRPALEQGYAVIYSTANETNNTYNIRLQEDTARRVKRQFIGRYGQPLYTMGLGGSGGGLQQYLLAQNAPGLIDGGVALIAYPDMVTQTLYALDCELLEYYFDHLASDHLFWRIPANRQAVMGLSVAPDQNTGKQPRMAWLAGLAQLLRGQWPGDTPPGSECNAGWRGSTPLINNPEFHTEWDRFARPVRQHSYWTHWQDNRDVYGTDDSGRAYSPWSNLGVQYGLQALRQHVISPTQFLELNARIGAWKPADDMQPARLWHLGGDPRLYRLTPYSEHNMTHNGNVMTVAPRFHGSLAAAKGAYQAGSVFLGKIDVPIMDVRMYLDPEQNIHHSWAALSIRQRLLDAGTNIGLSPLWITTKPYNPMWNAVAVMDQWLMGINQGLPALQAKPPLARDTCFSKDKQVIATGAQVWDGDWNGKPDGPCSQRMPFFKGSRQVAGDNYAGHTFHCHLQPVEQALAQGLYRPVNMHPYLTTLQKIFSHGVCDYRQADLASVPLVPAVDTRAP
tara:strand:+ start:552 stop:2774 length:2223 start_codon:yes stop_codon:yes gene_type:complete